MNDDNTTGNMARDALAGVNGGASALTPEAAPEPITPISSPTASGLSPDDGSGAIADGLKAPDQNALTTAINAAKSEAMKRMLRGMVDSSAGLQDSQPRQNGALQRLASNVANAPEPLQAPLQARNQPPAQPPSQPEVTMGRSIFGGQVPTYTRKDNVVIEFGDGFDIGDRAASAKAVSEANELIDMMHEMYENA